jgi:hypothetical protein
MSVLKWESNDENDCLWAETMQGEYMVCELNGGGWDCMFRDWQLDSKIYETKQAAMDACEVNYIARCTEFLTLYDPRTHVVVSRATLRGIQQAFANAEKPVHIEVSALAELRAALEVK